MIYRKQGFDFAFPGAASFNLFENEFDRGEQFNQCVKNLRK